MDTIPNIRLNDYVSGGYYITRRIPRPDWMPADLLPAMLFSASTCLCETFPDPWAIEWYRQQRLAALGPASGMREKPPQFGLPDDRLPQVIQWASRAYGDGLIGEPNVVFSVDVARRAVKDHLSDQRDLVLYGLTLHRSMVDDFLGRPKPSGRISSASVVSEALGVCHMMARGCDVALPAQPLGFEILGFEAASFHSWLCNGLERDAADQLAVRPNAAGFISSPADAIRVAEYCNRDDVGSEPVLWLPWLVLEYSLTAGVSQ